MHGGELFIPKIPSMKVIDLAKAVAPNCQFDYIGIRPGEKLHEVMISEDDSYRTIEFEDYYVILPHTHIFLKDQNYTDGKMCESDFQYRSDNNSDWLSTHDLQQMIDLS
jgi:UDP-N-acetylglucosamine 4,6-dehydratase